MVDIVQLKDDEEPEGDDWVLIQWKPDGGSVSNLNLRKLTYNVPEREWERWVLDGPGFAARRGLERIYYRGRPNAKRP